jgi:hypothetical protein
MVKAYFAELFKHPIRTLFAQDTKEMEAAWDMFDAEFREAVAELVSKLVARVRRLAGRTV